MSDTSSVDFLIIGGGIAGTTAAETIRKKADGRVLVVTDEPHPLYSRVRLPDYVAGAIPRERVFMKDESWYHDRKIELVRERTIHRLSLADRCVHLGDGSTIRYGTLLLASGGSARRLACDGSEWNGVHYLRTIDDADRLKPAIAASTRTVVIGGGFIGLELARCFAQAGLHTTIVLMEPWFWPAVLDQDSSAMIDQTIRRHGVAVHYSEQLTSIQGHGPLRQAVMVSGKSFDCDLLGVGIGIGTRHAFIADAGLQVGKGILTDEYLRTSDPHVFAAGDVAEFFDVTRGQRNQIGNWSNAMEQGKVTALNMVGEATPYRFVSNYSITVFGLSIGFLGDPVALPGTEIIQRGSSQTGSYTRFFVRDGLIKGATVLNAPRDMVTIGQLIKGDVRIGHARARLADPSSDLKSLLSGDAP
jgi:NAD(P)H-nitrite reductase large subunit